MENIVRIENLIFEYAGDENKEPLRAIKGISLDIEAGTFTAIIGRNGSGKSTLAKCLNGLFIPTGQQLGFSGPPETFEAFTKVADRKSVV